ncbi:major capsid protein [Thiorhodovibrio frisius]|uniref:Phage major capsid protein E n=1 Tax=Thiorhodovibrio frisius TaxID=631362 RepID=H8YXV3_9GAMM|nr:major capsid protein [Thiorhodovibrio frisius]EIC23279.1 Phage major capsid protein E [Thiorhodovibrio frisius]WPL23644.1 Phage major capsid protein E [Thiorhodovibrio frisius]
MYDTTSLARLIENIPTPSSALLDLFFPNVQTSPSEEIAFDIRDGSRRIAPFVSPLVAGKVMTDRGYTTKKFAPAYIKTKSVVDNTRPLKRQAGETIGGSVHPAEREQALVAMLAKDHVDMIHRRLELMAAEALVSGQVTVSGDQYPTHVVDFGRKAEHTVNIATGAGDWAEPATSTPANDLQDWSMLILQACGQRPSAAVMGLGAYQAMIEHADVQERLETRRLLGTELRGGPILEAPGLSYMGELDGLPIYVHVDWYIDPDTGDESLIVPTNKVIMAAPALEGTRAFGAIRDHDLGFIAQPFASKSWTDEDPSVRYLLTQSAPLIIPVQPNASLCAKVIDD